MKADLSVVFLAASLFIIMLGMGLSLTPDDFKRIGKNRKAVLTGLLAQLVGLPFLGFIIASAFPVSPEIAVGIMILAAAPGGPTSNLITHLAKGDTALSVSLTALSSLITIFTIPFIVNFSLLHFMETEQMVRLDVFKTISQIFVITIIPVSIGMLINHRSPTFALKMDKPVRVASAIVLALVIVGIIVKERSHVADYFQQAGLAALALNLATMLMGFYAGKVMKLNFAQSVTISIEAGIQNGTLAIAIASGMLGSTKMAIAPAVYSLIMFVTGIAIIVYSQRNVAGKSAPLS
jgi:bile acid:Na+ symporter, BASS family